MSDAGSLTDWLRQLVLVAGEMHLEFAHRRSSLHVRHKGAIDLVTDADRSLQEFLVSRIRERFPEDSVVAEEDDLSGLGPLGASVWYVDPIDGTTNFVHGHSFSCISVGRWVEGLGQIGAVFAPELDELFMARRNGGATLERPRSGVSPLRLEVSARSAIAESLLATGFPYQRGALARFNLAISAHFLGRARGIRRAGSAALDLCWVAAGRLDGYWEMALSPWDVAAGVIVAREAGATVSDFEGGADVISGRRVCAATPGIHRELLDGLAAAHQDPTLDCLAPSLDAPIALHGPLPGEAP